MKKRELAELRKHSITELTKRVNRDRLNLIKVHAKIAANQETNLKVAKNLKKDIAQLFTIISEKRQEDKTKDKKNKL